MDCSKANDFIMMYMDDTLSEKDATVLHRHFETCPACKADFLMYDQIMTEFATMPMLNAPENFEASVMVKINELPTVYTKVRVSADNTVCLVCGTFSVLSGLAFLAYANSDAIINYFSSVPQLSGYSEFLIPVSNYVSSFTANFLSVTETLFATASSYLAASRNILLAIFGALAVIQYMVYKKDKIKVEA